eukprot:TRINITY_DN8344_c0_g2_i4.p1 TRINITY_DN8344_c0_g2~~TRINITY_DN8344_c0_g2_i4.p1  ORF type:complete len:871 (+),score=119.50 TRINITY_DN8344_c0_g2_i4:21-2633(+)
MAAVVFAHFGASAIALTLRYRSRPTLQCLASCHSLAVRCCRCLRRCCCKRAPRASGASGSVEERHDAASENDHDGVSKARWVDEVPPLLKWYWFHLAMQVGFLVREHLLITQLNGWSKEVTSAHVATWLTLAVVSREVWNFSKVRRGSERQKVAVDGLLDMLLLPVNIAFFCALCVRVLKLQPDSHIRSMVAVVIESPDIYESFALWSVLQLFVKVVHTEAVKGDADTVRSFESFKTIALQGVKAWVVIQSGAVAFRLFLEGVVEVYAPTFCYWVATSCTSCSQWYADNIATALTAVTFILCSFAIMFVFYFETGYRRYLRKVEPMWKFLGVKGIVSVTYFQWIVISVLARPLGWSDTDVYLLHCLLYAFWMPIIAVLHTLLAYPYETPWRRQAEGALSPWLAAWLQTISDVNLEPGVPADIGEGGIDANGGAAADLSAQRNLAAADQRLESTEQPCDAPGVSARAALAPAHKQRGGAALYLAFVCLSCYASVQAILWLVPLDETRDVSDTAHILRNITCSAEGDLAHFAETQSALHFTVLNDTVTKWSTPGVAGAWLPLCAATPVGCQVGHYPRNGLPTITCTAQGRYAWRGQCHAISCGSPPRLPHATSRIGDVAPQHWTYGVTVHYDCEKPGFRGNLAATCNINGSWVVNGLCEEVACGPPPMNVPHAKPLLDGRQRSGNISTGMVVRYQCDKSYNGTPTATCGDDGLYVQVGRCRKECGAPPVVPHATPTFSNSELPFGWIEGMRVPYVCNVGFAGLVSAVCGADGNYTLAGLCDIPAELESEELHHRVFQLGTLLGIENVILFIVVGLWGWRACKRRVSRSMPLLSRAVMHEMTQGPGANRHDASETPPIVEPSPGRAVNSGADV